MSVSLPLWGDLLCRNSQGNASALLWGQMQAWLITVVHPPLELPHSPPLLLGVRTCAADWRLRPRSGTAGLGGRSRGGRRQQLEVEGSVTPALGGGSPPAVPIWGEKRPRGSSISSRGNPEQPMAAAERKHTLPLCQHQWPVSLNYFSRKEVYGQWTLPLEHWFICYTSFFMVSVTWGFGFKKKYTGIATESCVYCGQVLRAIYKMFLFDAGPLTVNSVKLALCSNYCITEKAISPTTCHVYTAWTNHWVEAGLLVSDVLPSVVQRLYNEAEPWSKLENKSCAGHFYREGSHQTSKSRAPPHPEWLTRGWFIHISVFL